MKPPQRLTQSHRESYGRQPDYVASAPGRVNLLGDHVDYNAGLALPCAIEPRAWMSGSMGPQEQLEFLALDLDERFSIATKDIEFGPQRLRNAPGWALYPVGVAWSLAKQGIPIPGAQVVIHSQIPSGSGLSSSAAIEVAAAELLLALAGHDLSGLSLAQVCQRAENEFVGVQSGLMDQWTAVAAARGQVVLLDFADLSSRLIPFPAGISIVVAHSAVQRSLANSSYNRRVSECREALQLLQDVDPDIRTLRDLEPGQLEWAGALLPGRLFKRVRHVALEIDRVRQGTSLLEAASLADFGRLMNESHASLRDLYEVSTPELEALVKAARSEQGCLGARLTGAGFGGCTVQLIQDNRAQSFMENVADRYRSETGLMGELWAWKPGEGSAVTRL